MSRTPDLALGDLSGRRALVTGASDGIGLGIARRLAAAGAELVLPVRDPRKGRDAVAAIRQQVPGALPLLAGKAALALAQIALGPEIFLAARLMGAGSGFASLAHFSGRTQNVERRGRTGRPRQARRRQN